MERRAATCCSCHCATAAMMTFVSTATIKALSRHLANHLVHSLVPDLLDHLVHLLVRQFLLNRLDRNGDHHVSMLFESHLPPHRLDLEIAVANGDLPARPRLAPPPLVAQLLGNGYRSASIDRRGHGRNHPSVNNAIGASAYGCHAAIDIKPPLSSSGGPSMRCASVTAPAASRPAAAPVPSCACPMRRPPPPGASPPACAGSSAAALCRFGSAPRRAPARATPPAPPRQSRRPRAAARRRSCSGRSQTARRTPRTAWGLRSRAAPPRSACGRCRSAARGRTSSHSHCAKECRSAWVAHHTNRSEEHTSELQSPYVIS